MNIFSLGGSFLGVSVTGFGCIEGIDDEVIPFSGSLAEPLLDDVSENIVEGWEGVTDGVVPDFRKLKAAVVAGGALLNPANAPNAFFAGA